jgi:hypothetical protein
LGLPGKKKTPPAPTSRKSALGFLPRVNPSLIGSKELCSLLHARISEDLKERPVHIPSALLVGDFLDPFPDWNGEIDRQTLAIPCPLASVRA